MARLESMAKMGYYPTPQELIPTIARYLKPKDQGTSESLTLVQEKEQP